MTFSMLDEKRSKAPENVVKERQTKTAVKVLKLNSCSRIYLYFIRRADVEGLKGMTALARM